MRDRNGWVCVSKRLVRLDQVLAKREFSVKEQCQVLGISRSGYYEKAKREGERQQAREAEALLLQEQFVQHPSWGYQKMSRHLKCHGSAWAVALVIWSSQVLHR